MNTIIAYIIVGLIVVILVVPWKWNTRKHEDTNHPGACADCNRGSCHGCILEGLTATQADEVASQITQQAIADGTVVYDKRFQKEV
jgi:hypothetical protein